MNSSRSSKGCAKRGKVEKSYKKYREFYPRKSLADMENGKRICGGNVERRRQGETKWEGKEKLKFSTGFPAQADVEKAGECRDGAVRKKWKREEKVRSLTFPQIGHPQGKKAEKPRKTRKKEMIFLTYPTFAQSFPQFWSVKAKFSTRWEKEGRDGGKDVKRA